MPNQANPVKDCGWHCGSLCGGITVSEGCKTKLVKSITAQASYVLQAQPVA